jgi:hypothetical protein
MVNAQETKLFSILSPSLELLSFDASAEPLPTENEPTTNEHVVVLFRAKNPAIVARQGSTPEGHAFLNSQKTLLSVWTKKNDTVELYTEEISDELQTIGATISRKGDIFALYYYDKTKGI